MHEAQSLHSQTHCWYQQMSWYFAEGSGWLRQCSVIIQPSCFDLSNFTKSYYKKSEIYFTNDLSSLNNFF